MRKFRFPLIILLPLALAGCATLPPPDREVTRIADAIRAETGRFHGELAAKQAPQCAYEPNRAAYANLTAQAANLTTHLTISKASPILMRAGSALTRAIEAARASHELASARSDDTFGLCLAPAAIALNADALARASAAISATQTRAGGN